MQQPNCFYQTLRRLPNKYLIHIITSYIFWTIRDKTTAKIKINSVFSWFFNHNNSGLKTDYSDLKINMETQVRTGRSCDWAVTSDLCDLSNAPDKPAGFGKIWQEMRLSGCQKQKRTFAYGAKKSSAVMCRRNLLVFVNFPKHVPTDTSLSREMLVANFRILSLWTKCGLSVNILTS